VGLADEQGLILKNATAGMIALLNSRVPVIFADLYTFALVGGTTLRYTPYDQNLTIGGNTWLAGGPQIKRSLLRQTIGLQVATMDLTIVTDGSHLVNGVPWIPAAQRGAFDGMHVLLERTAMPAPGDVSNGKYWKFSGDAGPIEFDRLVLHATVNSRVEIFNRPVPANRYQTGCMHTLFDAGCTLSKAAFGVNSTAAAGSTATQINCGLAQAAGYFALGTISFTSGVNAGSARSVKSYTPGAIVLARPLIAAPANGDAFTAFPGCDKTQATCTAKFANLPNFKATPYVPLPEALL
jgi:uncharacterized phage protein (TIGR02218 family)